MTNKDKIEIILAYQSMNNISAKWLCNVLGLLPNVVRKYKIVKIFKKR